MAKVYLSLGSNLGDKIMNLNKAVLLISAKIGKLIQTSSIYETAPWGFKSEHSFYNQVILIETELKPDDVLNQILQIEKHIGRNRSTIQYESRVIDIDILFYENEIIHTENLTIPHPLIQERRFTLQPLAEIDEDYIHPLLNASILSLLNSCKDTLEVKKIHLN